MTAHHNAHDPVLVEILESACTHTPDTCRCAHADTVERWARQGRRFRNLLERGLEPGPWMIVERDLLDVSQVPSGSNRKDLVEQLEAASAVEELSSILEQVLGSEVDVERIAELGGELVEHGEDRTVVRVVVEGRREWDPSLGGPGSAAEIERVFTAHARRAPWRDRKVRRLARVEVVAVEIHPDPELSEL